MSVEPKLYDQEAKLHDLVLQPTAVGSRSRHLAHQVQTLATFVERVRALVTACVTGWLDPGNLGARGPPGDMRISSGSCW